MSEMRVEEDDIFAEIAMWAFYRSRMLKIEHSKGSDVL